MIRVGEAVSQKVSCLAEKIIPTTETNVFLNPDTEDCCYELPVFGDSASLDTLKNDFTRFLRPFEISTTSVSLTLTKPADDTFSVSLVDDTLGTFYALGFHTDELGRSYIGFEFDWKKILAAHGEGSYQLKCVATTILGAADAEFDFVYCLAQYSEERADGTIRLSFDNSNILSDRLDITKRIYYPDNWLNHVRLDGFFGGKKSDYETTFTKYRDETMQDVEQRRVPGYRMRLYPAPSVVHDLMAVEVLQADTITITDYNQNNPWGHKETSVREPSSYEPTDSEIELLMSVSVDWKQKFDTGTKKYC